jgi:hypothetical protein
MTVQHDPRGFCLRCVSASADPVLRFWIFGISGFVPCVGRTSDTSVFLCYLPRNGFRLWCADGMEVSLSLEDFLMFRFFGSWRLSGESFFLGGLLCLFSIGFGL